MNKAAFIKIGFLLTVLFSGNKALAQARIDDECIRKIDPYYVYFTAFQPEPGLMAQRFCQKLPTVGRVITTVDYEDQALRDMKTEIRIIQVGAGGSLSWMTVSLTLVFFALVGDLVYYFSARRREVT